MAQKKLEQKQSLNEKLQQHLAPRLEIKNALNSVALVSAEKEVIFASNPGYSDEPKSQPLARNSQFLAGSIAKHFTAVALVTALHDQVCKEEKLKSSDFPGDKLEQAIQDKLQMPLSHYLKPEDPIWAGEMPAWANTVTLHQLLNHTSGLQDFLAKPRELDELLEIPGGPLSRFVDLFKKSKRLKENEAFNRGRCNEAGCLGRYFF